MQDNANLKVDASWNFYALAIDLFGLIGAQKGEHPAIVFGYSHASQGGLGGNK